MSVREMVYVAKNFRGVMHTTLNPNGPGVIRIHLVPAKKAYHDPSVVILNGQDIIPINPSWAILLNSLINEINFFAGHELSKAHMNTIVTNTLHKVKKIYPKTSREKLKKDLRTIVTALEDIAYGRKPSVEIGYMSIGEYAPYMKAPHRMDIMVSAMKKNGYWHCNQKCLHCYAAGQSEAETKELSTAEWKKIISKLRNIGIPQLTFTGGEPTMRDDLVELIHEASWFVTRLNTNGVKLTPELCEELYNASLDSVQITFYSNVPEEHNKLVGASNFENTVNGIKNAIEAGLSVSVNTPLCTINKDYVSTLKFLHDLGVEYVTCSGLIITGNATTEASKETQLSFAEMENILKEAVKFCNKNHMEISFTSPGWVREDVLHDLGLAIPSCGACLSNMALAPNGDIVPCQSWLSDEPLGNILTSKWETVWNKAECAAIRDTSSKMLGKCPLRNH